MDGWIRIACSIFKSNQIKLYLPFLIARSSTPLPPLATMDLLFTIVISNGMSVSLGSQHVVVVVRLPNQIKPSIYLGVRYDVVASPTQHSQPGLSPSF